MAWLDTDKGDENVHYPQEMVEIFQPHNNSSRDGQIKIEKFVYMMNETHETANPSVFSHFSTSHS